MEAHIVDTTLRDGEQKAGIALGMQDKIEIAKILNQLGIYQIEAGIPAMGGEEKRSIEKMASLGLKSIVSAWNRMNIGDIEQSIQCNPDLIHISVPCSDLQITSKLKKDRAWVMDQMIRCTQYTLEKGYEVTIGFEDASRADPDFLLALCGVAVCQGVTRVRYADTVGILYPGRVTYEVEQIRRNEEIEVEIHAHNDFGMAVANSIAAVMGGATYVDCTIGGLGERAGNCNYIQYMKAFSEINKTEIQFDLSELEEAEKDILKIIGF